MKHRLLILGTLGEFEQLVQKAREKGYYTIVCDGYPDGPARKFADEAFQKNSRHNCPTRTPDKHISPARFSNSPADRSGSKHQVPVPQLRSSIHFLLYNPTKNTPTGAIN